MTTKLFTRAILAAVVSLPFLGPSLTANSEERPAAAAESFELSISLIEAPVSLFAHYHEELAKSPVVVLRKVEAQAFLDAAQAHERTNLISAPRVELQNGNTATFFTPYLAVQMSVERLHGGAIRVATTKYGHHDSESKRTAVSFLGNGSAMLIGSWQGRSMRPNEERPFLLLVRVTPSSP